MTILESFFIGVRSKDRFWVNRASINFLILKQVQSGADSKTGRKRQKQATKMASMMASGQLGTKKGKKSPK
jgi:hypothetical protein